MGKLDYSSNASVFYTAPLTFSNWGPNFDRKCILGLHRLDYSFFQYLSGDPLLNSYLHYNGYEFGTQGNTTSGYFYFHFFCLGYGTECSDDANFYDPYTDQCLGNASCPVPPYGTYITDYLCPNCSDPDC